MEGLWAPVGLLLTCVLLFLQILLFTSVSARENVGLNHSPLLGAFLRSSVTVWKAHLKTIFLVFPPPPFQTNPAGFVRPFLPVLPVCPTLSSQEAPEGAQCPQQPLPRGPGCARGEEEDDECHFCRDVSEGLRGRPGREPGLLLRGASLKLSKRMRLGVSPVPMRAPGGWAEGVSVVLCHSL